MAWLFYAGLVLFSPPFSVLACSSSKGTVLGSYSHWCRSTPPFEVGSVENVMVFVVCVGLCGIFSVLLFGGRLVWVLVFLEVLRFRGLVVCSCGLGGVVVMIVLCGVVVSSLLGVVLVARCVVCVGTDGVLM